MQKQHMRISIHHILSLLRESIRQKDIGAARFVYSLALEENGFFLNPKLLCFLIKAFSSCGNLFEASKIFSCNERNVYTWSAIILAHAQHGESHHALRLYKQMKLSSITPNIHTYMGVLKACSNVDSLDQVYDDLIKEGLERDQYVGNMLINVYARHGDIKKSRKVFDELYVRDIVAWSAMITAYVNHDQGQEAISLFHKMWRERPEPDDVTLLCTLKACANVGCVSHGMFIYTEITKWFQLDVYIGSAIIDMYAKCSYMEDAQKVFDVLDVRNLICWNAIISGYANCRKSVQALHLVTEMQHCNLLPNETTFVSALKACAHIVDLDSGMLFHITILKEGIELDPFITNSLICLYAKCDCIPSAFKIFEKRRGQSLVSWGTMISGLVGTGHHHEAVTFYVKMNKEKIEPDNSTLVSILKACSSLKAFKEGRLIYCDCVEKGLESDLVIGSSLLEMFTKCGNLSCSRKIFDSLKVKNIILYSVLMSGYTQYGHDFEAIQLLENMREEGTQPNEVSYICILKACTNLADLIYGKVIHYNIVEESFESIFTVRSTLVVMYAKLGCLLDAYEVFNQTVERDVVLWSAVITGFSDLGYAEEALILFEEMQQACVHPNEVTFACVLKACASLASLDRGKHNHTTIVKQGFDSDTFIGNTLVDMYSKCGSLASAHYMFDSLHERDLVSWSAIIEGYANHGLSHLALKCFYSMEKLDLIPAEATYVSILSACSNAGLLEEGQFYFTSINSNCKFLQTTEHYACMVDLLGKAGQLNMAGYLALGMPLQLDDVKVWMTLLGACARFGNMEIGTQAYYCLMKRDFKNITAHILLSNIYATNHLWEDAKRLQNLATWTEQKYTATCW